MENDRFSRFYPTSNPPPSLAAVFREMRKAYRRRSRSDPREVRGLFRSADGLYEEKGKADDLLRFLRNTQVLIEDSEGVLYFDVDRSEVILACCESREDPPAPVPVLARIAQLQAQSHGGSLDQSGSFAIEAPAPETLSASGPPSVAVPVDAGSPATVPEAAPIELVDPEVAMRYLLYLTPVESDIWESLLLQVRQITEGDRIPVARDPELLHEEWASATLDVDAAEYAEAFMKFVEAGIIRCVGKSGNGHDPYTFTQSPASYHIIRIGEREARSIPRPYFDLIRDIETGRCPVDRSAKLRPQITAYMEEHCPTLNVESMLTKLCGYDPNYSHQKWGITHRPDGVAQTLIAVPGFERYDFQPVDEEPRRVVSRKSSGEQPAVLPASQPASSSRTPTPALMPAAIIPPVRSFNQLTYQLLTEEQMGEMDENRLAWLRAEIDQMLVLLNQQSAMIDKIDQDRLREKERRLADIMAKQAALKAEQAALKAEEDRLAAEAAELAAALSTHRS